MMIDGHDPLPRKVQIDLEVVVLELAVSRPAVQPAGQPSVVGDEVIDLAEGVQAHSLQAVVDAAQGEHVGVFQAGEAVFTDDNIFNLSTPQRDFDQGCAGFIVGEVGTAKDIHILFLHPSSLHTQVPSRTPRQSIQKRPKRTVSHILISLATPSNNDLQPQFVCNSGGQLAPFRLA